jgi:GNAT superfamily N-acetyltransferase
LVQNRDLWAEYKLEREGVHTLREGDLGFAAYSISGEECYIQDIHVVKEAREQGIAAKLADRIEAIAKEKGCKYLTGTVVPSTAGATVSALAMIKVGFEIYSSEPNKIVFLRRIK